MAQSKSSRAESVRSLIRELEPDELREVIVELCRQSTKNRRFLELYVRSSGRADPEPVAAEAKEEIWRGFYGHGRLPKLDLRAARRAVTEYGKVLREFPRLVAGLKLYYVKTGLELTKEFGDMTEGFYRSLVSMYGNFARYLRRHPELHYSCEGEIRRVQSLTGNLEWEHRNEIDRITSGLLLDIPRKNGR